MDSVFRAIAMEIESAGYGKKKDVVAKYTASLGVSEKTLYRRCAPFFSSDNGRKKRADAGETQISDEALRLIAALMLDSVRGNGKQTMDIPTAKQILLADGYDIPLSDSRIAALLREKGYRVEDMKAPASCVRMRSLHPNHVHQVDPSLCLLYYTPSGEQRIIKDEEAYKNKPFMEGKKSALKIWRYVLVDHYSGTICHRYYQVAGENQLTLWDFLLYAWNIKADSANIFHGIPEILVWDKGSANTSASIANACKSLRIKTIPHAVGNARAKGSVENANNLIETLFESRLKKQPVSSVEELNDYAEKWDRLFNANLLDGYDSSLTRADKPRIDIWSAIKSEDLIELPEGAESLLMRNAEKRQVRSDLTVTFVHPRLRRSAVYAVGQLPGITVGKEIMVQPIMVNQDGKVLVSYICNGEEIEDEILPCEFDEVGFRLDAPVFGESFKRNADTVQDKARKNLTELIGDQKVPFVEATGGKGIGALDAIKSSNDTTLYFPRVGKKLENPHPAKRLSILEASQRIRNINGWFDIRCREVLIERYPDGPLAEDIQALAEEFEKNHREAQCIG